MIFQTVRYRRLYTLKLKNTERHILPFSAGIALCLFDSFSKQIEMYHLSLNLETTQKYVNYFAYKLLV